MNWQATASNLARSLRAALHDLPYEDVNATGATEDHPYRRIIEDVRTLYRADDLTGAPGIRHRSQSMALPYASYKLAFTPGLLALYQRGTENLLPTPASVLGAGGAYVLSDDQKSLGLFPSSDPSGNWWIPSGQVFYSPNPADTPAQELASAQAHFFLAMRYRDPFLNDTIVSYDTPYDLLPVSVQDAAQNTITTTNDYRVLQPELLTDPNGNQSKVAFDGLGLVVGTAVMGKKATEDLGDTLDVGFETDLTQSEIDQFFADPTGAPAATLLGRATSRIVYDLGRFARQPAPPAPAYAATITRETHVNYGQGQTPRRQVSFSYSDGFGREIQRKMQVDPGPLTPGGPVVDPRWVVSGWTIFNNKGKPVRQYEPFFYGTQEFVFGNTVGVSATMFYDPVGRAVATLHPNHSYEKVVFDPWRQETYDVNDTVSANGSETGDPRTDADIKGYVAEYFKLQPSTWQTWYQQRITGTIGAQEQDAATKTEVHANTPTTAQFDTLGRAFLTFAFNRYLSGTTPIEEHNRTVIEFDIEGNQRTITDALGRTIMTYDYDMLGTRIRQQSVDAGERWMLNDATGKPLLAWDSRDHRLTHAYDMLHRPTSLFVQTGSNTEITRRAHRVWRRPDRWPGQRSDTRSSRQSVSAIRRCWHRDEQQVRLQG